MRNYTIYIYMVKDTYIDILGMRQKLICENSLMYVIIKI